MSLKLKNAQRDLYTSELYVSRDLREWLVYDLLKLDLFVVQVIQL